MPQPMYQTQVTPVDSKEVNMFEQQDHDYADDEKKEEAEEQPGKLHPGKTDEETIGLLVARFDELAAARPDKNWDLRYKQYEAVTTWNSDGTANVNLPIEQATIRNKMADELSERPGIRFRPTEKSDIPKIKPTKILWDYVWTEADTDQELFNLYLGKDIFGTFPWYEYVHTDIKTMWLPEINKEGKVNAKPVRVKRSWLRGIALDIRDLWIDPVRHIDDAEDCFIRERDVSYSKLDNLRHDPNYKNIDEALQDTGDGDTVVPTFTTTEEQQATLSRKRKFTLWHYYNKAKGVYIVLSTNKKYIIREGPNPFPHGELPISIAVDHKKLLSIYGEGEPELLEGVKYERNVTRNQFIDLVRSSNTTAFAVGDGVSFERSDLVSGVMQIWNFQGNLQNAQVIKPQGPDSGLLQLDEMFKNDATWITGIDNNALAGQPSRTAFEARLQEVTKLKGISVSSKLMDYFFVRMARQRLANMQFYISKTTGKRILDPKDPNATLKSIPIEGKRIKPKMGLSDDNKIEEVGVDFEDAPGEWDFLELTPEFIQSSLDVTVETPSTTPILREIDKSELREVFNMVIQAAQIKPELLEKFDIMSFVKDSIEHLNQDPDKYFPQGEGIDAQKAQDIRSQLLEDLPMPFRPMGENGMIDKTSVMQDRAAKAQSFSTGDAAAAASRQDTQQSQLERAQAAVQGR